MTQRRKIKITQQHIDDSMRRDSGHCMIADSVRDSIPSARYISVDLQTIRFSIPSERKRFVFLTPRKAQEAIVDFDQGDPVKPFAVELRYVSILPYGSDRRPNKAHLSTDSSTLRVVPIRIGGKAPPRSRIGNRREFGIRAYRQ